MSSASYTDAIVLFGDSLTQAWSEGSLAQRMSEHYSRRADVINRGFGGYTSEWAVPVFEQVFATKEQRAKGFAQHVPLITIWLGANDACLPGSPQHVPVEKYKQNLIELVNLIRTPESTYYSPKTKIVLITAPPVIPTEWLKARKIRWRMFGSEGEEPEQNRDAKVAKEYVAACKAVAEQLDVPVVDLWQEIVTVARGEDDDQLKPFFYDGLHLTSDGYAILHQALVKLINEKYPELNPETMPMRMPHWDDVDPQNPREAFDKVKTKRLAGEL